jgi:hypothetical protein
MEEEHAVLVRSRPHACFDVAFAYMSVVAGHGDVSYLSVVERSADLTPSSSTVPPTQTTLNIA